ncbi:MAG: DMT family transporter [Candidatus Thorarchaeota archaeon]
MKTKIYTAYFLTILAGFTFGLIPIISALMRDNQIFTSEQAFLRLFFGALFGLGIIIISIYMKKNHFEALKASFTKSYQLGYFIQGTLLAIAIYVYLAAISLDTPVGEAALLVQVHPIVTLIIGWIFLKESLTRVKIFAVIIAMMGIGILAHPWTWTSAFTHAIGDLLCLSNGFFYALYLIVGRYYANQRKNIPSQTSIAWVLIYTFLSGIILIVFLFLLPLPENINTVRINILFSPIGIIFGLALALFGSLIPYGLIMMTSSVIESSKASILLLGEAISAVILAFIILNELITIYYIIGGFFIFLAIYLIIESENFLKFCILIFIIFTLF